MTSKGPFQPKHSMILWFYDLSPVGKGRDTLGCPAGPASSSSRGLQPVPLPLALSKLCEPRCWS